jgi:hypothetical protein
LVLLFGFICLLRQVALVLAYPGHLQLVVRDGEQAFAKITKRRLLMFIEAANEVVEVSLYFSYCYENIFDIITVTVIIISMNTNRFFYHQMLF